MLPVVVTISGNLAESIIVCRDLDQQERVFRDTCKSHDDDTTDADVDKALPDAWLEAEGCTIQMTQAEYAEEIGPISVPQRTEEELVSHMRYEVKGLQAALRTGAIVAKGKYDLAATLEGLIATLDAQPCKKAEVPEEPVRVLVMVDELGDATAKASTPNINFDIFDVEDLDEEECLSREDLRRAKDLYAEYSALPFDTLDD